MTYPPDLVERVARAICRRIHSPNEDPELGWQEWVDIAAAAITAMAETQPQWRKIEGAPMDEDVLLYCPNRGITNEERIELGVAHSSSGSHHSWASHWMPLPALPERSNG